MDKITQQNAANSEESASAREKNNFRPLLILVSIVLCTMQIAVSALAVYEKAIKDVHTIVVGTELDYPPYSFLDEKGNPSGYNVELTRAIARVMGLNVEIQIGPWGDIRKALEAGKIDVISGMYCSVERDKVVDFSPPYTVVHHAIFVRRGTPAIETEEDLRGKDIIVMRGDIMHDYVLEKGLSDKPVMVGTQADALQLLASGEHDCALVAKLPGLYWVKELGLLNIVTVGPLLRPSDYSYAVTEGNAELLTRLAEGLAIIEKTNRLKEIYDKWLGVLEPRGVPPSTVFKYIALTVGPIFLLLVVFIIWSRTLKRQVAKRTKDLRESEENLRTTLDSIGDAVIATDTDGNVIQMNPVAETLTGWNFKDAKGKPLTDVFNIINARTKEKAANPVARVLEKGKIAGLANHTMLIARNGSQYQIADSGSPIRDVDGNITGVVLVFRDVTEEYEMQEALRERVKELTGIYNLSHLIEEKDELPEILQGTVDLIPDSWQYPDITCARLVIEGKSYTTQNYEDTAWSLSRDLLVAKRTIGTLDIGYLEARPQADEGPFLKEEGNLITAIAERLQRVIEHKRAEEALEQREHYYRTLIFSIHEDILVIDRDYRITDINNMPLQTLEMNREEAIGRYCYEVSHGLDAPCNEHGEQCGAAIVFDTGESCNLQHEHVTGDGKKVHIDILMSPMKDEDGNITHVVEAARDVTNMIQTQEALRESEEKYRTILANMEEGYYEVDLAGNFTFINDAMCRIRGMSRDELMRTNNREYMIPETAKGVYEAFNKVYTTGEPARNVEWETIRLDGTKRYAEASISLIKGSGNAPTGFRGVVRDVTERRRAEEDKKRLESQLQQAQKMESIGTLAGGIAHDFNNVLYSIIGYAELTMEDVPEGSLAQKNLKEVLNGALRARDMVKQILAFSRKDDTEKKPVKIQSIVKEALILLRSSIPSTIEIRRNIDENCSPVLADSTKIHQVIMNLATNAYQAMREKCGVLELTLMEEEIGSDDSGPDLHPGTYLKLTLSDTGHGMDETVMEKIFDPYFTTRGPGEGTGMGLAVVHGIVKSHGGDIRVYSKLGEGTTFHVYLPLIETRPVEPKTISAKEPAPIGTERILFVDDEEYIVLMTQQILQRLGYQVTSRTSSVEALEAFRVRPDEFDLVITDMTMPNMTGVELTPKLLEIRPDIPIILCSGFSEMIDEDKARKMGISAYIMKPVVKDEIARSIREVLDKLKFDT